METPTTLSKYILVLLLWCIGLPTIAQLPDLIPYRKGDLWGYCDSNKVVKIEPRFKYAGWFNELGQAEVHNLEPTGKGDSSYVLRYIDKDGNITNYQYFNFDSKYYYYYSDEGIVVVEKQTRKKRTHPYEEHFIRNGSRPINYLYFKSGDTLHIYLTDRGYHKFVDSAIEHIKYIVDDNYIAYTDNSTDSTEDIIIHSKFNGKASLIFSDKNHNPFILYSDGRKYSLAKSYIQISAGHQGVFIIKTKSGSVVYNKKRKNIFKSKHSVKEFGSKLLIEYDEAGYFSNIIDLKGNYVAKDVGRWGYTDYVYNEAHCVYYMNSDSCYVFYNQAGKVKKICRKEPIINFTKNFIVFKTSDATLDVYNKHYKLVGKKVLVDFPASVNSYYDHNFLAYYYEQELHLMSTSGTVTPINYKFQKVIPVNNNYFLGFYTDSLFYHVTIVLNSSGEVLHTLREHYGSYTLEKFIEKFNSHKKYYGHQIVLPIVSEKEKMDDYYTPIQQAGILSILKDTVYTINLGDSICWISANYTDAGPATSQFNIITRCNTNPEVYKPPVYYYIDKYGTIYYDE